MKSNGGGLRRQEKAEQGKLHVRIKGETEGECFYVGGRGTVNMEQLQGVGVEMVCRQRDNTEFPRSCSEADKENYRHLTRS